MRSDATGYDRSARSWREDPARMALPENAPGPDEIDPADDDAICFTGGQNPGPARATAREVAALL